LVSVVGIDPVPDDLDLSIDIELLEPKITADHTARLRISTTNNGPERAISLGTGQHCHPFNRTLSVSDPAGLMLQHSGINRTNDRKENRWELDLPPDESPAYRMYGCPPRVYAVDESVNDEYGIWHDYRADGYLNPGRYRWERAVQVWDGPVTDGVEPTSELSWGFSLTIEDS
jgi:hypothetical protein